jgi:hypothetical protein
LERLSSIPEPEDLSSWKIVDGWNLHTVFTVMLGKYLELLRKSQWEDEIFARYRLVNTWNHVLFFDSPSYISYLDSYGVLICLIDKLEIPDRLTKNFIRTPMPDNVLDLAAQFAHVVECLGFQPMSFADMFKDGWNAYLQKMQEKKSS